MGLKTLVPTMRNQVLRDSSDWYFMLFLALLYISMEPIPYYAV